MAASELTKQPPLVSRFTVVLLAAAATGIAAAGVAVVGSGPRDQGFAIAVVLVSLTLVGAGAVAFGRAMKMREPGARHTWALVAASVVSVGFGCLAWGKIEYLGAPPTDWWWLLVDVLVAVQYAAISYASIRKALEFRRVVDVRRDAVRAALVGLVLTLSAWAIFYVPAVQAAQSFRPTHGGDLFHAMAGVVLGIAPATFLMLVLARANGVGDARAQLLRLIPWLVFAVAVVVLAIADVGWFWAWELSRWNPGSVGDVGLVLSQILFVVSVLLARDVERVAEQPAAALV